MGKEIVLSDAIFDEEVLKSEKPVLVDFWAPWCGPCRIFGPVVEEFADEYSDKIKVCKLNVDENQQVSNKYGISSIPTVLIFNKGEMVREVVGAQTKEKLISLFDKLI